MEKSLWGVIVFEKTGMRVTHADKRRKNETVKQQAERLARKGAKK